VKLLALSTNNRPDSDGKYVSHEEWVRDVDSLSTEPLRFPLISDPDGKLSRLFNVLDDEDVENLNRDQAVTSSPAFKSRHIFIIGPEFHGKHHFRLILNYPAAVGFNTSEVYRAVDCLQTADLAGVRTPADWIPGGEVVIPPGVSDTEARERFPQFKAAKPYLRYTSLAISGTAKADILDITEKEMKEFHGA